MLQMGAEALCCYHFTASARETGGDLSIVTPWPSSLLWTSPVTESYPSLLGWPICMATNTSSWHGGLWVCDELLGCQLVETRPRQKDLFPPAWRELHGGALPSPSEHLQWWFLAVVKSRFNVLCWVAARWDAGGCSFLNLKPNQQGSDRARPSDPNQSWCFLWWSWSSGDSDFEDTACC